MQQAVPAPCPSPPLPPSFDLRRPAKSVENFHAHTHNKHTHRMPCKYLKHKKGGEGKTEVDSGRSWQWAQLTTVAHFRLALCNDLLKVQVESHAHNSPLSYLWFFFFYWNQLRYFAYNACHTHKFLCGNFCTQFTVDCHKSQHGWASSRLLLLILLCCCLLCPNAVVYFWTRFSSCVPFSLLAGKLFTFDAAEERSLKVAQNNYRYI